MSPKASVSVRLPVFGVLRVLYRCFHLENWGQPGLPLLMPEEGGAPGRVQSSLSQSQRVPEPIAAGQPGMPQFWLLPLCLQAALPLSPSRSLASCFQGSSSQCPVSRTNREKECHKAPATPDSDLAQRPVISLLP